MTTSTKPRKTKSASSKSISAKPAAEQAIDVAVKLIHADPRNRAVAPADAKTLALSDSIINHGQQQDILLRTDDDLPNGNYRIVFGERRWKACMVGGLPTVRARIRTDLTSAEALQLMAIENDERENLNDIERAGMINQLCKPELQGGSGMTRHQAGSLFKLSPSAASNLVRLLKLPAWVKKLIISGEMPQTFGRELCTYPEELLGSKAFSKAFKSEFDDWLKHKWNFPSRESFAEDELPNIIDAITRAVEPASAHQQWEGKLGETPGRLFELSDFNLIKLKLFKGSFYASHQDKRSEQSRTLNIAGFDQLQRLAVDERVDKRDKGQTSGAKSKSKTNASKKPTAAELKAKEKKQREVFQNRAQQWRMRWIRHWLSTEIQPNDGAVTRFLFYELSSNGGHVSAAIHRVGKNLGLKMRHSSYASHSLEIWKNLTIAMPNEGRKPHVEFGHLLAADLLWPSNTEKDWSPIDDSVIDSLGAEYELCPVSHWNKATASLSSATPAVRALYESFWNIHSGGQLADLIEREKLNIRIGTKRSMVDKLLETKVNCPACLKKRKAAK